MKLENKIALRYIKSKNRNKLLSFLFITSVVGIMLGVATLIIVVSVMSGFTDNLKEKLLGANSDIIITRFDMRPVEDYKEISDKISSVENVVAVSPFLLTQMLLTSDETVTGVIVRGVEPIGEAKVTKLSSFIISGDLEHLNSELGIVLGKDLAINLGVKVADNVTVVSPLGTKGPFGMTPKMKKFNVVAIFDAGMYEYNSTMAYVNLKDAQTFLDLKGQISGFGVSLKNKKIYEKSVSDISKTIKFPFWVRDWLSMNQSLFSALKLEQFAMYIILTLIIIVASFNIVSMISITVKDKRKDIAILRAFGASNSLITGVFIRQGLAVGILGTLLGDLLALLISWVLMTFRIIDIPQDVYFMDKIPINIDPFFYLLVTASSLAITFVASYYPARQAAKMSPIEALRNDN